MAIAYDSSAQGSGGSVTSITFSHTCSGSDRMLVVFVRSYQNDRVTGVTYNGVAMTQVNKRQDNAGNNCYTYLYYLLAPATGANNVVVSASPAPNIQLAACSASYTGVKQSGQPDSSAMQSSTASTMTVSTTVVASGCWLVGGSSNFRATSAGTGTTNRQQTSGDPLTIADSNGTVATGSRSLQWTQSDSTISAQHIISIAPVPSTNYTITADAGSYTLTGVAAILKSARTMVAVAGSYVLTGTDAALKRGYGIVAEAGSYAITGTAATLTSARRMVAEAGSYALTGTAAALKAAFRMAADAGSYILTGFAAGLTTNAWSKPSRDSSSFAKPSRPSSTWTRPDDPNQ